VPGHRALPRGLSFWHPVCLLGTFFGVGLLPLAPGTWGSLAALPIAAWTLIQYGPIALALLAAGLFVLGIVVSEVYSRRTSETDPGPVVIDEVAGQWITLLPAATSVWWHWVVGFALFRFFDIVKPWPIGWADRRVKGGFGVMIDDVVAGIYAGALLYALMLVGDSKNLF